MSLRPSPDNQFLTRPPGRVFAANALPMMLIMLMNGLLNIIDAAFLGHFVGTGAMTAIGLVFPAIMVLIALSTLVSGGMSSLLARQLGAGDTDGAGATLASAHVLFGLHSQKPIRTKTPGHTLATGRIATTIIATRRNRERCKTKTRHARRTLRKK